MAQQAPAPGRFQRAGQFLAYLLFRAVEGVLWFIPIGLCGRIGRLLGMVAYFVDGRHRAVALRNLQIAFGREQDARWRRRVARAHFRNLGGNLLCSLKLPLMSEASIARRVAVDGMEHARAVAAAGHPMLYAICHMGCWELLTQVPSLFTSGLKPASIYQALGNPWLDAHVKRRRQKLGYVLFDRSDGFAAPMKHLREDRGAIGVLVDQHAGDHGVWCPFFDRLASTSNLAALMSLRCRTPLLPLAVYTDGPARWRLVCYPPVNSHEATPTADGLTAMLNIAVEIMVRRAPENWFWVHNRWKTPRPDFLVARARRGIALPTGYDFRRLQPFELLVRSPNWLGDACMALPAVRALKKGRPDLRLTVLAPAKLGDLWRMVPEVDAVILKEPGEGTGAVARKIRAAASFEAAVLFTNSTRSALEAWRAGVPRLAAYQGSLRRRFIDQVAPEPRGDRPPPHHATRYLRLAEFCGANTDDPSLFGVARAAGAAGGVAIGICAGAEYGPAKRWPLERFAAVARQLSGLFPEIAWLLFGAPGEKELGAQLSAALGDLRHENLVGRTSLSDLVARLRGCRLLLTNDTGTMHLAAALGVPTVSIFGSTEPKLTGPLGAKHRVVRHHVPCSPCFERECPLGHYACLTGVSVEQVLAEVLRLVVEVRK